MKRPHRIAIALLVIMTGGTGLVSLSAQSAGDVLKMDVAGLSEGKRLQAAQDALRLGAQDIDQEKNFGQALDLLIKAQTLDPDLAQVEFEMGRLYDHWKVQLKARALQHYQAFVAKKPRDGRGLTHLANLLAEMEQFPEAEASFKQATAADPNNSWFWEQYAQFLVNKTKRYQDALAAAERCLALLRPEDRDNSPWPLRHKGIAQAKLGQKAEAIATLEKAIPMFKRWNDSWQVANLSGVIDSLK